MRVLLADDSSTMRKIQKRVLAKMEINDIVEARNGYEALKILKREAYDFDFVLMDINMPRMSGLQALKRIRADEEGQELPVIMCTSVAEKNQVVEAIKAGASTYIVKPFRQEHLQAKLEGFLTAD